MRQASSTIKGYLYQFNKSIFEILNANDDDSIILEGVIEDIDIQKTNSITTIQCKYHEDKKYQISSIAIPILEMLCHYNECSVIGKNVSYILYAFFAENIDGVKKEDFVHYIETTNSKDIQINYFHRIYEVLDSEILDIANKPKKSKSDKEQLLAYYEANRKTLKLCIDIDNFWKQFTYRKAEKFDDLRAEIIDKLTEYVEREEAENLYYPNAFSLVSSISSKLDVKERTINKKKFINCLSSKKSVLITKWMLAAMDKQKILKNKRAHLSSLFAANTDIRAFVFSDEFIEKNNAAIIPFIQLYLEKYFRKPKLHRQPIFIFGNDSGDIMQRVILGLHKYQKAVNSGMVGNTFLAESFIKNSDCSPEFVCKIALLENVDANLLEQCNVNQLYIVGSTLFALESTSYIVEMIDIEEINVLKYLVGLDKVVEV